MNFSIFNSVTDREPKLHSATWDEITVLFSKHNIIPEKKAVKLFSGATFTGSRAGENVKEVSFLTLDFDNKDDKKNLISCPVTPEIICAQLHGYAFILATSFSHKPEWPKFRVTLPLASPIPGSDWKEKSKELVAKLGLDDPAFFDGLDKLFDRSAQIYFLPSAPSLEHVFSHVNKGTYLSVPVSTSAPRRVKSKDFRFTPEQISKFYSDRLPGLNQVGREWRSACPIHEGSREDAFSVSANSGLWTCFADCNTGGDIYALEMALKSLSFSKARESVNEFLEIDDGILPGADNFATLKREVSQITGEAEITPELLVRIASQPYKERREIEYQLISLTQIAPEQINAEIETIRKDLKEKIISFPRHAPEARLEEINSEAEKWGINIPGTNYIVDPDGLGIYPIKNNNVQYDKSLAPRLIWIDEIADNVGTHETWVKLNWLTSNLKRKSKWMASKQTNSKEELFDLDDSPISLSGIAEVSKWLAYQKQFVEKRITATSRLGWIEDQFIYDEANSPYNYLLEPIKREGSIDDWFFGLDILLAACSCNIMPWAVLGLSVASPLVRFIRHRNPILGLISDSSLGKGSVINFALSIWGERPRLTIPAGSTVKGVQDHAHGLSDIPVFLDEMQQLYKKDKKYFEETVYFMANGQRRITSSRSQVSRGGERHYGVFLFAAEQTVSKQIQKGAQYRITELEGIPVPDAWTANSLQKITEENFGQIGLILADLINTHKKEYVRKIKEYSEDFSQKRGYLIGDDSYLVGCVKFGLELLAQISGRDIDAQYLSETLADYMNMKRLTAYDNPTDLWIAMIDQIMSGVWSNADTFEENGYIIAYRGKELMDQQNTVLEINPTSPTVQRILNAASYTEDIGRTWAKAGWIVSAPERVKWKRSGKRLGSGSRTWRITDLGLKVGEI